MQLDTKLNAEREKTEAAKTHSSVVVPFGFHNGRRTYWIIYFVTVVVFLRSKFPFANGWRKVLDGYLSSVDSRTIRSAFWLLSSGLHLCLSNCS
jgi:hypothetical protein